MGEVPFRGMMTGGTIPGPVGEWKGRGPGMAASTGEPPSWPMPHMRRAPNSCGYYPGRAARYIQ